MSKNMYQKRKERKAKSLVENGDKGGLQKNVINWYPGHMAKTKKEIGSILSSVDVVIEVIDARIPYSSKIPDIDNIIKNKNKILVFNKYDLCDELETNKWINYYKEMQYECVKCNSKNDTDYKNIINKVKELMQSTNEYRAKKGLLSKRSKCIVIGVPNVGKSTIINKLCGKKALNVGNRPGVTKMISPIRINEYMDLLDTPGILWPKLENNSVAYNLASMTIIKEEILPVSDVACHILKILNKYYKDILYKDYGIKEFRMDEIEESFIKISKFKNIPVKDEVDYDRVSVSIINDIKQEKIVGITFDRK